MKMLRRHTNFSFSVACLSPPFAACRSELPGAGHGGMFTLTEHALLGLIERMRALGESRRGLRKAGAASVRRPARIIAVGY